MNEQETADLFSSQIDRLLGGEPAVDLAVNGDLPLLALGQQLTEISFQPSPTAQAAFHGQLASWFGSSGGGLSTTAFGLPKILLMSLGAALAVIGAGLGVVVLISFLWTGALFDFSNESRPEPGVTPQVTPNNPLTPLPALASPEVTSSPTRMPTTTKPHSTSSIGDVLPDTTTSVGDTILRPTGTPTSTTGNLGGTATPNSVQNTTGDDAGNNDSSGDTSSLDDPDRGHGNDPGGYDPDNPGQSDGVSGGNSSGSLSGGGNSTGNNAGGGGQSNGGNNDGGGGSQGGNHGGGKGNK
jgi:hypothetical protein